ncbi:MAG: hypothetical protein KDI55_23565, partial [Anaerolineae bacterium]|nr:hypothetical protein [Anaerolineae bacterium]
ILEPPLRQHVLTCFPYQTMISIIVQAPQYRSLVVVLGRVYQLVAALAGLLTEPTQRGCFWTGLWFYKVTMSG